MPRDNSVPGEAGPFGSDGQVNAPEAGRLRGTEVTAGGEFLVSQTAHKMLMHKHL
jgi:hypothetical protein